MTAHQLARKQRAEDRAERVSSQASATLERAHTMAAGIPFGQPILVGHHSERRDRNYRERIGRTMDKGCQLAKEADSLAYSAKYAGLSISSDDPEAVSALTERLAKLEANQAKMAAANKLVRKKDRAGLESLGFTAAQVEGLLTPDFCGRLGFPSYALTNNNANIRRIRERIASLEAQATRTAAAPVVGDGWRIVEDVDENRLLLEFDAKPDNATISKLKSHGFRWSPTRGAWSRMLNNGARYAARYVLGVPA